MYILPIEASAIMLFLKIKSKTFVLRQIGHDMTGKIEFSGNQEAAP